MPALAQTAAEGDDYYRLTLTTAATLSIRAPAGDASVRAEAEFPPSQATFKLVPYATSVPIASEIAQKLEQWKKLQQMEARQLSQKQQALSALDTDAPAHARLKAEVDERAALVAKLAEYAPDVHRMEQMAGALRTYWYTPEQSGPIRASFAGARWKLEDPSRPQSMSVSAVAWSTQDWQAHVEQVTGHRPQTSFDYFLTVWLVDAEDLRRLGELMDQADSIRSALTRESGVVAYPERYRTVFADFFLSGLRGLMEIAWRVSPQRLPDGWLAADGSLAEDAPLRLPDAPRPLGMRLLLGGEGPGRRNEFAFVGADSTPVEVRGTVRRPREDPSSLACSEEIDRLTLESPHVSGSAIVDQPGGTGCPWWSPVPHWSPSGETDWSLTSSSASSDLGALALRVLDGPYLGPQRYSPRADDRALEVVANLSHEQLRAELRGTWEQEARPDGAEGGVESVRLERRIGVRLERRGPQVAPGAAYGASL